jgi:RNA polymerase sigma factor (sigma-70 family)
MGATSVDDAETWRAIKARNDWRLVDDDPQFVVDARRAAGVGASISALEQALLHAYRRRLYNALRLGDERAAAELRHTCYLRARANGLSEHDAADAAQETMRRVLERLDDVQVPEAIVSYALTVQRSMLRDLAARFSASSLDAGLASGTIAEPAAPNDVAHSVEQHVVAQHLAALIARVLTHPMERLAVQRIVIGGEKPRDVAHDLGLPLHRVRVHKSRALQRLRADPAFVYACVQLMIPLEEPAGKEQEHDFDQ